VFPADVHHELTEGKHQSVDLTKRQREIFDFIRRYLRKYGYPPTVREIGKALGLHSPSTVHAHLAKLEQIGMLRRDPSKPRAIELMVGKARRALKGPGVPVVGNVAAGEPILAEENIEDYYEVPSVIGGEGGDFILKIRGDSMKDVGILEGDYVVVRPADEANNGEIVVALIGDEATVKRFYRERNQVRLQPENKAHKPIRTKDVELLGKVIGVFREV
jgi:repressor LexA